MIGVGVDLKTSSNAIALARAHDEVWAGAGHHPTEASEPDIDALRELARDPRVAVIGEVGLDFERAGVPRERQIRRLDTLFGLAVELDLPVFFFNDTATTEIEALIDGHPGLRGVMHYFALGWDDATRFLDRGFHLSFAGLVTRPSRHELRDVVKRCPADRMLLETDSPYGNSQKRMGAQNRPAYLLDTAELVAELRGISIGELGDQETANALALFSRMR